jgi:hypothetical protein
LQATLSPKYQISQTLQTFTGSLDSKQLTSPPDGAFTGLSLLNEVDLSNNSLTTFLETIREIALWYSYNHFFA